MKKRALCPKTGQSLAVRDGDDADHSSIHTSLHSFFHALLLSASFHILHFAFTLFVF